ncbi:secreted RxLR effector protein 161-like [Nicotiana tomentosiformis]|uniref:secreted RxLR effector protein 161-like n=1 Tax=Nicotiana tomentosiformis TaxID=4098 RepID=UPI00388C9685
MDSSKLIDSPIAIAIKLDLDEEGKGVEKKLVGLCARFQANPKESYLKAVKRILRYLKVTPNLCLWYPKVYIFDLVGYADVDYAWFHVDSKSISGTTHFLGSYPVSWGTKKQNSVALSATEAEYVVATS